MSEITITIPVLAAYNIVDLVENRLSEIERLAKEFPNLPMKDPETFVAYEKAKKALDEAIAVVTKRELGIEL